MARPLKVADIGSGKGRIEEFSDTDTIPFAAVDELGTAAKLPAMTSLTDTTTAGALMLRGAFGFGGANPVDNAASVDDLLAGQRASWSDGVDEQTCVARGLPALGGSPTAPRSWHVECYGRATSRLVQMATEVYGSGTTRGRTFIRVKHDAIWYPWVEMSTASSVLTVSASRALTVSDASQYLRATAAVTLTVPTNTTAFIIGAEITVRHGGTTGNVTLAPASGVVLNAPSGGTLVMTTRMTVTLKKVGTNEWDVIGQTVPA